MEKERMATKTDNGGLAFCIIKLEPTRPFSFSCFIFAGKMKMRNTKRRYRTRGRNLEGIITTVRPVHLRDWRSFFYSALVIPNPSTQLACFLFPHGLPRRHYSSGIEVSM